MRLALSNVECWWLTLCFDLALQNKKRSTLENAHIFEWNKNSGHCPDAFIFNVEIFNLYVLAFPFQFKIVYTYTYTYEHARMKTKPRQNNKFQVSFISIFYSTWAQRHIHWLNSKENILREKKSTFQRTRCKYLMRTPIKLKCCTLKNLKTTHMPERNVEAGAKRKEKKNEKKKWNPYSVKRMWKASK